MQKGNNKRYRCLGYIDGMEVGVLHSPRGQSILVRQGDAGHQNDLGCHLAGMLGCVKPEVVGREGVAFWSISHDDQADRLLRQIVDVLISIRYAHPTLVQLRLDFEEEPVATKGDRP